MSVYRYFERSKMNSSDWIKNKKIAILENDKVLDKILTQHASGILDARSKTNLFDFIYKTQYSSSSLESKSFINFGSGSFQHHFWKNADKLFDDKKWSDIKCKNFDSKIDISWDMYKHEPYLIESNSIEVAYSSHVIEHGFNEDVQYFFDEVFRILKFGGTFRVVAPDVDLYINAMKNKDYSFMFMYKQLVNKDFSDNLSLDFLSNYSLEKFLLENVSLITTTGNRILLNNQESIDFFKDRAAKNIYEVLDEASYLSDRPLNEKIGAHVNWFNFEKTRMFLEKSGFKTVLKSRFGQSINPVLRDVRLFDRTDPFFSFYIDAVK